MDGFETHFGVNKDVAKGYVQCDTIYVKSLNVNDTVYWYWILLYSVQL